MKHILFVASVLLFAGCKKDATGNYVKTVTQTQSNASYTSVTSYTYDSKGRLWSLNNGLSKNVYVYSDNNITITSYNEGDTVIGTSVCDLNVQGLVEDATTGASFYYDALGEKILQIFAQDSVFYAWNNGDQILQTQRLDTTLYVDTFAYLATVDNRNFGQSSFGKQSTHLLSSDRGSIDSSFYTYIFDSKGRVYKEMKTIGSAYITYQYTYY